MGHTGFRQGGVVVPAQIAMVLGPDECLVHLVDGGGRLFCVRADHAGRDCRAEDAS